MTPEQLDALAKDLHHEWDSPGLWPRIAAAATPMQRQWTRLGMLAAMAAALIVGLYLYPRPKRNVLPAAADAPLLSERALADVETAETAYRKSIDRLARVAAPRLNPPATPLLRAYAEKLALLDGAIAGLRSEVDRNGFNAHLHLQMAAVYRDKQKTLEEVIRHE
jgi:hypothetical protein